MKLPSPERLRVRKNFGRIKAPISIPYLLEVQKKSYSEFLQKDVPPEKRKNQGLQEVFNQLFPIKSSNGLYELRFVKYEIGEPRYEVEECKRKKQTYAAPLHVNLQFVLKDPETREIMEIKEEEIYFGEIPLMTDTASFVINGTERVVVNQLHRSPGVVFVQEKVKTSTQRVSYTARIIPYRGSWLDFEFDHRDYLFARIDRKKKLFATYILRALGMSEREILSYFYRPQKIWIEGKNEFYISYYPEFLNGLKAQTEIYDPDTGKLIYTVKRGKNVPKRIRRYLVQSLPLEESIGKKVARDYRDLDGKIFIRAGEVITEEHVKKAREARLESFEVYRIEKLKASKEDLLGKVAAKDHINPETGEIIFPINTELTEEILDELMEAGIKEIEVLYIDNYYVGPYLRNTLKADRCSSREEALIEIYRKMRPGDPHNIEAAEKLFYELFFDPQRYDLSEVGRVRINEKLKLDFPVDLRVLTKEDILETVRYLLEMRDGRAQEDDIDHLGNRRVRSVGELVENQFRAGMVRIERAVQEKFKTLSFDEAVGQNIRDIISSKPVISALNEFFGSSQLSQFMDQVNPLSETTHKRRLSALGPGGLTRERAGFEVRDVHTTHYGRICPIETPEGPNIGLISSLTTYARVNKYGFIETPYRIVKDGKVTDEIVYLTAPKEENHVIAQANAPVDENGNFINEYVAARKGGEFIMAKASEVTLMDVSPNQVVSVAASLIPFLEHDDANRALMGSNMQRQAVPLMKTEAPFVGTGMEKYVATDSGVSVVARRSGTVEYVDSQRIVIRVDDEEIGSEEGDVGLDIYNLKKFRRSNQDTTVNQKPIVKRGDYVKKGEIIADGHAIEHGELALGRNVLVAFIPWRGYNFEDAILVSERLVKEDVYTSIHIEEFEVSARETKLGPETITRDIPGLSEEAVKNLDEEGIIRIGAEVKPGDILVGKITPKGESQLDPEDRLLKAIFGSKAGDFKDSSLRVPPGVYGTVIGVDILTKKGVQRDRRAKAILEAELERLQREKEEELRILYRETLTRIKPFVIGQELAAKWVLTKDVAFSKGHKITEEEWKEVEKLANTVRVEAVLKDLKVKDKQANEKLTQFVKNLNSKVKHLEKFYKSRKERLEKSDELSAGEIKRIKVYVAIKRKLQVGDKMAGRHGNKGVISRILPLEDMPFLPDGTPVDVVLNPLGVPSRMNVGQVLETHLGWAAKELGKKIAEMVEKATSPQFIREYLKKIYGDGEASEIFDSYSDEEIIRYARKMKNGIHIATPVFDGAKEEEIKALLKEAGLPESGQTDLYDGRTGEKFHFPVTVGVMYMLKLNHLVEDKVHARSTGPYSLITQQPLGGKAQFGGQRLGEMEVWALEAYGAAYSLQEFLTVKSDDIIGRTRIYDQIVKGNPKLEPGVPESFNVLFRELRGLALNVELLEELPEDKEEK